jgi:UDP-N-acetylglucosamine 2-epimerase (non-hydrolysing)
MNKTKITTFVGTRPEIIRLSEIIKALDESFDHRLVHTGQNPDPQLKDVFFEELGLRPPDNYFSGEHKTLGGFIAQLMVNTEIELTKNRPDGVVILGDTNSALAAILARRLAIPVYHLEAGNRSFDANVPEEINRKLVDHIADFNFPYSELARSNLLAEGLHPRNIFLLGSPLKEVLMKNRERIQSSSILETQRLKPGHYFMVSMHRQENVDSPERLGQLLMTLNVVAETYKLPVLVSVHPRTKRRLVKSTLPMNPLVRFNQPFGFLDYIKLQMSARVVLSDSGTISEESSILGFNAVTIRDSMERPEALESGAVILSGITPLQVLEAIRITETFQRGASPSEYQFEEVSSRFIRVLTSTIHQHAFWNGIRL